MTKAGEIEIIIGPMFAGKTSHLIERIRTFVEEGRRIQVFKHSRDDRYAQSNIVNHDGNVLKDVEAVNISNTADLTDAVEDATSVVVIDEVQFFDPDLIDHVKRWAIAGKFVLCVGLDTDHKLRPFKTTMRIVGASNRVVKLLSRCERCNSPATYSKRLTDSDERIDVGGADKYEPRCRKCWDK